MAITMTLRQASSVSGSASGVTSSISPAANSLILVAIGSRGDDTNPTSVSGGGIGTFDVVRHQDPSSSSRQMSLYRGMSASPGSGTITISYGASQTTIQWAVIEVTGVETGANGANAIVQDVGDTDGSGSATTITPDAPALSAFADAVNNAVFAYFFMRAAVVVTHEGGYTELHEQEVNSDTCQTEWKIGEDLTPSATWSAGADVGVIACEIAALAAGGGVKPDSMLLMGV